MRAAGEETTMPDVVLQDQTDDSPTWVIGDSVRRFVEQDPNCRHAGITAGVNRPSGSRNE